MACKNGHKRCVELLISKGALVAYEYMDESQHCVDSLDGFSMDENWQPVNCLDVAIDNRHT